MRNYLGLLAMLVTGLILVTLMLDNVRTAESQSSLSPVWQEPAPPGGGDFMMQPKDRITDEERAKIKADIQRNIEVLTREGKLSPAVPQDVSLGFPVIKTPGVIDFDVVGISNFVDHNSAFPNQIQDYNCGVRTYDLSNGYNHKGVDIFTWPFGWNRMDNSEVQIVSAAPGTIVHKADGNFDRSCSFSSSPWNAVYVRHADNSVAWYGHMKNGSTTTKAVGDTVVAGEYLGIVGSSGSSTGPHLHFELYDSTDQLKDPYQGTCNTMNANSWWADQEPYRVPKINRLLTGSAPPMFPACPQPAAVNEKLIYRPGDLLVATAFYRDQNIGHQTQYAFIDPDGAVSMSWLHNSPNTYNASYWFWSFNLPLTLAPGQWKFRATYQSEVYETAFVIASEGPFDFDGDGKTDVSVFRPAGGEWWYGTSSNGGHGAAVFGTGSDVIAPADYTGDGKTDMAFFRPSTGEWFFLRSEDFSFYSFPFGGNGDIPAPADYDGDGKADAAVYRPSTGTWYVFRSSDGQVSITGFGVAGDQPIPADYDGDGMADIGIFRPNGTNGAEWWILRSTAGLLAVQFGGSDAKAVPGDYTGDGKADVAFFSSTGGWYILRSEDLSFYSFPFGVGTDIPVPGDYDGDGRIDAAVFRNSAATWFMQGSTSGTMITSFGVPGDRPVPNAFVR